MIKFFQFITEIIGWFQIILFPLIIGLFIGAIIYYYLHNTLGFILGIIVATSGLVVGIILAASISKKKGTVSFLSRIQSTPELDNEEEKNENIHK